MLVCSSRAIATQQFCKAQEYCTIDTIGRFKTSKHLHLRRSVLIVGTGRHVSYQTDCQETQPEEVCHAGNSCHFWCSVQLNRLVFRLVFCMHINMCLYISIEKTNFWFVKAVKNDQRNVVLSISRRYYKQRISTALPTVEMIIGKYSR